MALSERTGEKILGNKNMKNNKVESEKRLTINQCVIYALPYVSVAFLFTPIHVLQGIYAKYYGITLTAIATIILVTRLFDAVADPLVGYISDRYFKRKGTRKPFVVLGGLLSLVSGYFLYVPHGNVTAVYFAFWLIIFYLGWTLFEIPHLSWASELASKSHEKTRLYSYRTAMGYLGLVLFYAIPLLPFFDTQDITPETLRWCAIVSGLIMLPALYLCVKAVPDGKVPEQILYGLDRQENLKKIAGYFSHNKPLLIHLGYCIFVGLGAGMWFGLIFIYVDVYLGMGDQFAQMFLAAFIIGIAATPGCYKLSGLIGKKNTLALAALLLFFSSVYIGFLNSEEVSFFQLSLLKIINTLGFLCFSIVVPSMLSDITDYSTWKFKTPLTGVYFAFQGFLQKTFLAIGGGLALAIAGWFGFEANAEGQNAEGIYGMYLAIVWIPTLFFSLALVVVLFMPMTSRRHDIVRRRLASRAGLVELTTEARLLKLSASARVESNLNKFKGNHA